MAEIRRKMDNFDLVASSPTKKKFRDQDLSIHAEDLTLQKINNFWGGTF
jgi:hypothetical protein